MKLTLRTWRGQLRRFSLILGVMATYIAITVALVEHFGMWSRGLSRHIEIRNGWFYQNGEKLLIKGVGYDPTRPGELPWAQRRSQAFLTSDLERIRDAGFNTIRTWEALSRKDLDEVSRLGLFVLQGIWIDSRGNFSDPEFRRRALLKITQAVNQSRGSPAILGYLVINEPEPAHVLAAGVTNAASFLRELGAAVRVADPGVPVGFANWPGAEFLDDPTFDFAAVNLYPFRPGALREAVGYEGMVRLWKARAASNRALLVSEFGISVSPSIPGPDAAGGVSEADQARMVPALADAVINGGAAGGAVFMWIDAWWKNNDSPKDEMSHDPNDGEEWFGLVAMDAIGDGAGRARPVLGSMKNWNRAVLTRPLNGDSATNEIAVEVFADQPGKIAIDAIVDGQPAVRVATARDGSWLRGKLTMPTAAREGRLIQFLFSGKDGPFGKVERALVAPSERRNLKLSIDGARPNQSVIARATDASGKPLAGAEIRVAATEASRRFDRVEKLATGPDGAARMKIDSPPAPSLLYVAGALFREGATRPEALDQLFVEQPKP